MRPFEILLVAANLLIFVALDAEARNPATVRDPQARKICALSSGTVTISTPAGIAFRPCRLEARATDVCDRECPRRQVVLTRFELVNERRSRISYKASGGSPHRELGPSNKTGRGHDAPSPELAP